MWNVTLTNERERFLHFPKSQNRAFRECDVFLSFLTGGREARLVVDKLGHDPDRGRRQRRVALVEVPAAGLGALERQRHLAVPLVRPERTTGRQAGALSQHVQPLSRPPVRPHPPARRSQGVVSLDPRVVQQRQERARPAARVRRAKGVEVHAQVTSLPRRDRGADSPERVSHDRRADGRVPSLWRPQA